MSRSLGERFTWQSGQIVADNLIGDDLDGDDDSGAELDGILADLLECGGEGGKPGPCPDGNGGDQAGDHPATTRARQILAKAGGKLGKAARATVDKVKEKVKAKYAKMEARYGRKGALAVMAACVALTPVPVPGTSFAPIAVAELALAAGKLFKGGEAVEGEPDVAELARALAELMAEAYRTAGEEPPVYDDGELEGAIRGALAA